MCNICHVNTDDGVIQKCSPVGLLNRRWYLKVVSIKTVNWGQPRKASESPHCWLMVDSESRVNPALRSNEEGLRESTGLSIVYTESRDTPALRSNEESLRESTGWLTRSLGTLQHWGWVRKASKSLLAGWPGFQGHSSIEIKWGRPPRVHWPVDSWPGVQGHSSI